MDFVTILIILSELMIVIGLLLMVGFGLRALLAGRKNFISIGAFALAVLVFFFFYVTADPAGYTPLPGNPVTPAEAAIVLTAVTMLGLGLLALAVSAVSSIIR